MAENPTPPSDFNSLNEISKIIARQKEHDKDIILAKFREAWANEKHVDLQTLREFGHLGDATNEIIYRHPFASIDRAIAQVRIAFGIHRDAYEAIIKDYGGFHAGLLYQVSPDYNQLSAAITSKLF